MELVWMMIVTATARLGQKGSTSASNSDHGTTWFIWSRNSSRLLLRPYFAKLDCDANVC